MPSLKNRVGHPFTEEIDENSFYPHDRDISIFKAQGGPRDNLESRYWEKTS